MYPRSVITLLGDDREDVCGTVLYNLWKERFSTSSSVYMLEPPGPYFRASTQPDGTSQLTPNLTVVNPQLKRWRLPDSNGLDETSLSGLWSGSSLTINRAANFEGENSESSSSAVVRASPLARQCLCVCALMFVVAFESKRKCVAKEEIRQRNVCLLQVGGRGRGTGAGFHPLAG